MMMIYIYAYTFLFFLLLPASTYITHTYTHTHIHTQRDRSSLFHQTNTDLQNSRNERRLHRSLDSPLSPSSPRALFFILLFHFPNCPSFSAVRAGDTEAFRLVRCLDSALQNP